MNSNIDNKIQLSDSELALVFGGTPLNIDINHVSEPLAQRNLGFPGEHGFTTNIDGRVPVPFIRNMKP